MQHLTTLHYTKLNNNTLQYSSQHYTRLYYTILQWCLRVGADLPGEELRAEADPAADMGLLETPSSTREEVNASPPAHLPSCPPALLPSYPPTLLLFSSSPILPLPHRLFLALSHHHAHSPLSPTL